MMRADILEINIPVLNDLLKLFGIGHDGSSNSLTFTMSELMLFPTSLILWGLSYAMSGGETIYSDIKKSPFWNPALSTNSLEFSMNNTLQLSSSDEKNANLAFMIATTLVCREVENVICGLKYLDEAANKSDDKTVGDFLSTFRKFVKCLRLGIELLENLKDKSIYGGTSSKWSVSMNIVDFSVKLTSLRQQLKKINAATEQEKIDAKAFLVKLKILNFVRELTNIIATAVFVNETGTTGEKIDVAGDSIGRASTPVSFFIWLFFEWDIIGEGDEATTIAQLTPTLASTFGIFMAALPIIAAITQTVGIEEE